MVNDILLLINALSCGVIALRLMFFRREGKKHRPVAAWCAYFLIIASAIVAIKIAFGEYAVADWSETFINFSLCMAVMSARGNVMNIFKRVKHQGSNYS